MSLPDTLFTVWTPVFERGRLAAGKTLVHGGASGIGTTAALIVDDSLL